MGFFSSLKKNFSHGGVTLDFVTPDTVRITDENAQMQLTITNTSSEQIQVNSCKVSLHIRDIHLNQASDSSYTPVRERDITTITLPEVITIAAGQQQVIPITFPIRVSTQAQQTGSGIQAALGQVSDMLGAADVFENSNNVVYTFVVVVDVEGITFDPSKSNIVHLLGINEIGSGSFKVSL